MSAGPPSVAGLGGAPLEDPVAAEASARRSLAADPGDGRALFALGVALHARSRLAEALEAFRAAAERLAEPVDARNGAAVVAAALGRTDEALELLRLAHAQAPDDPLTLANTGILHEQRGAPCEALDAYAGALELDPTFAPALLNRAPVLARLGRLGAAEAAARRFVEVYPERAEGHFNLAEIAFERGRAREAIAACDACLALAPGHALAWVDRALAHARLGRFEAAEADLRAAEHADREVWRKLRAGRVRRGLVGPPAGGREPAAPDPRAVFLVETLERIERADWDDYEAHVRAIGDVALGRAASGVDERSLLVTCWALPVGDAVHRAIAPRVAAEIERRVPPTIWTRGAEPGERIRVGYLSPDVCDHAAGYALRPLVRSHDRERFEIRVYALGPDDGGDVRRDVQAGADALVDLDALDDESAAWAIFRDGCNVLVDFAGYTRGARTEILAYRPAPVQITYQGYHASLGARFVDYHVTSLATSPAHEHWTEARCFLPGTHFLYDDQTEVSSAPLSRAEVGLSEDAVVLCCFNQPFKVDPETFSAWLRIARRVPGSVLWLHLDDPAVERRLRSHAAAGGLDPARIVAAPGIAHRALHLARMGLADLYLDPLWCNGHTTLCDALWSGLPAIVRRGSTPYARLGASVLETLGTGSLIAPDTQRYVELAVALASERDALEEARAALARCRETSTLFDPRARTRALEAGLREMVRRHRAGEAAGDFAIEARSHAPRPVET